MTMTIKELVLEILYSKPVHFSRTNRIGEDKVKEWIEQLLLVPYDTLLPPSQRALSRALQRGNYMMHTSIMRNNL